MKTIVAIAAIGLLLAGCASNRAPSSNLQYVLVEPPAEFLNCPQLRTIPDAETLTNAQIAQVIVTLDKNNKICVLNMEKIKEFVKENRKVYANSKKK